MSLVILRACVVNGLCLQSICSETNKAITLREKEENICVHYIITGFWQSIKLLQHSEKFFIWLGNRYVCHGNYPLLHISHKINGFLECMKNCRYSSG